MWIGLRFIPHASDIAHPALSTIFSIMPRIVIGSFTAFLISNFHDVWVFGRMKERMGRKGLWLRNNVSTMISQGIDSLVFCFIAFWGMFSTDIFIQILVSTYVLKWIVASLDTPFVYWARRMKEGAMLKEKE
jgi:hypothetical protein